MTEENEKLWREENVDPAVEKEIKWQYLRQEIDHNGVWRLEPGSNPIKGKAPNTKYTHQFYLRRCLLDPTFLFTAAELLIDKLPTKDVQIGACETAGVSLGIAMATYLKTPMITIKKTHKEYGLLNYTEGKITGKPILLVDDLAGSQNTLKLAEWILTSFKLPMADQYVTLVDKTQRTHYESYLPNKQLISLFRCEDFSLSWNAYVEKYNCNPNFGPHY